MKAKYFTARSQNEAEALAMQQFGCEKEDLTIEVISNDAEKELCQILALLGTDSEIANMNAMFEVYYEPDGVYLELYENRGTGAEPDNIKLSRHLTRKRISGINEGAVQMLASKRGGRTKIAEPQSKFVYGEDIEYQVAPDELLASAILLPPEEASAPGLDFDKAMAKLREVGVSYGIDEEALKQLLAKRNYDESIVVARAIEAIDGENGKLIFHFSKDEKTGIPKEIQNSGGRVDYKTLDLFEAVTEGQLLLTRELASAGQPGVTVRGRELKAKPGKEAVMPRGKNVSVDSDKLNMHAKCSGMVQFINNTIHVSNLYKISGDCDISIGNIDFDGSVQIGGCVRSGHTVKATGSVIVGGVVEAATIIAGGNVEVKGGMQGGDKGVIEAGGDVTAMYIERGTVIADGSVKVDVAIKSNIEAGGIFVAKGKRGAIIGGRVSVAGDITANYLGALSNVATEVEVGAMPRKRARLKVLEVEQERLAGEMVKLAQMKVYLANKTGKIEQAVWDKLYFSGEENKKIYEQNIEENKLEIAEIKEEIENATNSKVHILNNAYVGARLIIGNSLYIVKDDIQYATFKNQDGEIVYVACEKGKG